VRLDKQSVRQVDTSETAAVMQMAVLFVGHDSGPMHLRLPSAGPVLPSLAPGTAGEWYPFGARHRILYHQTPCFGCRLTQGCDYYKTASAP